MYRRPKRAEPLARDPTVKLAAHAPPKKAKTLPEAAPPKEAQCPPEAKAPPQEPSLLRDIMFLLAKVAAIVLAFTLVFTLMYGLHRNMEPGMKPAILDGDLLIFYRLDKTYVASDVVMLDYEGQRQARRVVAMAGDVVDINEDGFFVNGSLQQEPGIYEATRRYEGGVAFPLTVGEGQVFVLADARENGTDSRVYGPVEIQDTLGKVITVLRRRNI